MSISTSSHRFIGVLSYLTLILFLITNSYGSPLPNESEDAYDTASAAPYEGSNDTVQSGKSTEVESVFLTERATSSSSNASFPTAFDTIGNNFTASSCPQFFEYFLTDETYQSCHAVSLLLQNSNTFFKDLASAVTLDQVLDTSCSANTTACSTFMNNLAANLTSDNNCGADYKLGNPIVTQAYNGMVSYEPLARAICLEDPKTHEYCFTEAATNNTNISGYALYLLPLGNSLPGGSRPECNQCTQATMAVFEDSALVKGNPLVQTYIPAAQTINLGCGPNFVNATVNVGTQKSGSSSKSSASRLSTASPSLQSQAMDQYPLLGIRGPRHLVILHIKNIANSLFKKIMTRAETKTCQPGGRASNLACRTVNRPREQRQRILISDQYEKKIEIIEERLARIEGLLENLTSLSAAFQHLAPGLTPTTAATRSVQETLKTEKAPIQSPPSLSAQAPTPSTHGDHGLKTAGSNAAFEGASSLSAHSVHASRIIENAMSNDYTAFTRDPEMQEALFALRHLIDRQHSPPVNQDYRFPNQQVDTSSGIDFSSVKMPPLESVVSLLRLCKESQNFLQHPFIDFGQFNELCKRVYFATEDYSLGTFALVNGGLFYLFQHIAYLEGKNVPEAFENAAICRANLEYAISRFSVFMAPNSENLQAILIGASYAIDISQPSLCWALVSTAARLCQTLGYHRSVGSPGDNQLDTNLRKRMFWFTYILDKCLSLRMGHSSIMQDFDITLPLSDLSADSQMTMWDIMYHQWIKIGYFQGRIYEELYSPRALSGPATERTQRAKQLTADMQLWYQESQTQLDPSRAYNPLYYAAAASSSEIMYYGLSTLAYRAVPPGPLDSSTIFSNECIAMAREALRAHQRNTERYKHTNSYIWHGYISWVLINCPFTPFMVLFCHAIATANLSDLKCLGDFVSSLQTSGETVEAAEKLRRLCHVFHRVAELYIHSKIKQQQQQHYQYDSGGLDQQQTQNHVDNIQYHQHQLTTSSTPLNNIPTPQSNHTDQDNAFKYNNNPNPATGQSFNPIDDFEPYLSALGFPNAAGFLNIGQQQQQQTGLASQMATPMTSAAPGPAEYNSTENLEASFDANSLENWFTGNVNLMSLLEMDLSSIIK
ncbi:C6 transcription factor, putative [Talaromyces stipitatus ATCC 10500]|uniref:C6 transcription factor, putative n=1 Tax=Talaromyces stipitatus (strain ATCC 10500 / CBS 375.48 / QM 6759 / NRRL 1006) TaxID=441959 RepID=B8MHD9_TALSN|nr:C6 transcription factor, putative [Talaromyces stipitatus ATCC 10500]EED17118.1 C6 transcription factor, putative [Talaromyces stipitatus ATCC 10500]